MDDLSFLDDRTEFKAGNATLTISYTDGSSGTVSGLNLAVIEVICPLLALAFEDTRSGPRHYIENVSRGAIASLLRYIHVFPRDYIPEQLKSGNMSMLLHVEVYHLATIYDMADLKMQACSNVTQDCELACSTSRQPLDVCNAIKFIYEYLSNASDLIETITNYCVTCFLSNKLDECVEFRNLAFETRQFQQDICTINWKRGFVDDAAMGIIQLPIKPYRDPYKEMAERRVLGDFLYDLWEVKRAIDDQKIEKVQETMGATFGGRRPNFAQAHAGRFPLPYRPRTISRSDRMSIIEAMTDGGVIEMASPRLTSSCTPPTQLALLADDAINRAATHKPRIPYTFPNLKLPPKTAPFQGSVDQVSFVESERLSDSLNPEGNASDNFPDMIDHRGPLIDFSTSAHRSTARSDQSNWADPSWVEPTPPRMVSKISKRLNASDGDEDEKYIKRAADVFAQAKVMLQSERSMWSPSPATGSATASKAEPKQQFPRTSTVVPYPPGRAYQALHPNDLTASDVFRPRGGAPSYSSKQHSRRAPTVRPGARPQPENVENEAALHSINKLAQRSRKTIFQAQEQFRNERDRRENANTTIPAMGYPYGEGAAEPFPRIPLSRAALFSPAEVTGSLSLEEGRAAAMREYKMQAAAANTEGKRWGKFRAAKYSEEGNEELGCERTTTNAETTSATIDMHYNVPTVQQSTISHQLADLFGSGAYEHGKVQKGSAILQTQSVTSPPSPVDTDYDMVTTPSSPPARPAMASFKPKGKTDKVPHLGADYDPVVPPSWMMGAKKIVLPACENGGAESVSSLTASTKTLRMNESSSQTTEHDDFLQVDAASDSDWDLV